MSYYSPYRTFVFHGYSWRPDEQRLTFTYSFDRNLFFQEEVTFVTELKGKGYDKSAFEQACLLAHVLSGISYYKAYPTKKVEFDGFELTAEQAAFFTKVYKHGLGEYLFRNELEPNIIAEFPGAKNTEVEPALTVEAEGRLLLIGGGKDSLLSADVLQKSDLPFTQFRVDPVDWVQAQMDAIGSDQLLVERRISKNLLRLNENDALNGHVPITGILMSLAVITAILTGKNDVVLSNEASANEPNVTYKGLNVNHQYSKSLGFEKDFQNYVKKHVGSGIRVFSLLRPLSELAITESFTSRLWDEYKTLFSSSNSNFKRGRNSKLEWNLASPKTASVFGMLSAFLEPKELTEVFEENLYERHELQPIWKQLYGLADHKPFECVASIDEMRASAHLAGHKGWGDVAARFSLPETPETFDFRKWAPHELPGVYEKALKRALS